MKLVNKIAVITGGNSGIGLESARLFKREGASIAIFGRNQDTLQSARKEIGKDTVAIQGDVRNLDDIEKLMSIVQNEFGRIDILFVNAGIAKFAPFPEMTEETFDELTDIHFKGTFFTLQKALPLLVEGSSVIFVASMSIHRGFPLNSVYDGNKAAIASLGRSLQAELLEKKIRINTLCPGLTETPILGRDIGLSSEVRDEIAGKILESIPVGRLAKPSEMANVALFLASDDSSYMYGSEVFVDGGRLLG